MEYLINYVNEGEFKKLERSLKKYNMLAFKKLAFEYYPSLKNGVFLGKVKNGKYEITLPCDETFTKIHGELKLIYSVDAKDKTVILETITPEEILLDGYLYQPVTYKGVMISKANSSKDRFKIDLLEKLKK